MHFVIDHQIRLTYSRPVFCEPMILRLSPRQDRFQRLLDYALQITPEPTGRSDILDAHDNMATSLWFSDQVNALTFTLHAEVETLRTNAFDFIITDPLYLHLPLQNPPGSELLRAYLTDSNSAADLFDIAQQMLAEFGHETIHFLAGFCQWIYDNFETILRETGDPWPAWKTFLERRGACRDLAVLFIAVCRVLGLPARFVSGYGADDDPLQDSHLHAWAEVWLPGGGWRGYDPSVGLAVADRHVILAAAADPADAAPTSGSFRGTGVTSILAYDVQIQTDQNHPAPLELS